MDEGPRPPAEPRGSGTDRTWRRPADPGARRSQQAVFRLLFSIAQSDATLSSREKAILARYRRALDVHGQMDVQAAPAEPAGFDDLREIPAAERAHVLRMMFRVAYADGACSETELNLLRRLSGVLGLPPFQFADILVSIEQEVRHRRRTRRWLAVVAGAVAVVAVVVVLVYMDRTSTRAKAETEALFADTKAELDGLRERIERAGGSRQARQDLEQIRERTDRLERLESELLARIAHLEGSESPASRETSSALAEELASVKAQLAELEESQKAFQRFEKLYADSVLLILVRYDLVKESDRRKSVGFGSGFFVTSDGMIVTNKHVVQPWKFVGDSVKLLEDGYVLDEGSVRVVAWTEGSDVFDADGKTVLDTAFDSGRGTLEIVASTPDEIERRPEPLSDGSRYTGRFHAQNDSDLVLLQATVTEPVTPLPLARDLAGLEKLDPVMVLGFPSGPGILERGRAETSPSLGEVRKIEDSLFVTAPIVPGNSGGPVIDREGRVIGVASRAASGEATLGCCIKSRHVLTLMTEVRASKSR